MDIFIVVALVVVVSLLAWDIAQRRSALRESRIRQGSEDTLQAVLEVLGQDRQERQVEARAFTEKAATAAAVEAARMAKAELETQTRSSADLIAQQQRTFSHTAKQIGSQIERIQSDLASRQGSWSQQFGQVSETLAKLGGATESLTNMLNSSGQKGSWGEKVAEDILRAVGLKEGVSYEVRKRLPGGQIPDFAFHLPRGQLLCMDSKLPFDSYRGYQEAGESEKEKYRKEFLRTVRGHVRSLSAKSYGDAGLVLMFIPLESIYAFIWGKRPGPVGFRLREGCNAVRPLQSLCNPHPGERSQCGICYGEDRRSGVGHPQPDEEGMAGNPESHQCVAEPRRQGQQQSGRDHR